MDKDVKIIDTSSNERSLVTVQLVEATMPIEGADLIELAKVLGWQCVIKKGEFKVGDKALYFEVDSFLPYDDERYLFLKNSLRKTEFMGIGYRIKSIRLRGQISQGLLLPLSEFPEIESNVEVGTDVTELLRVKKWYVPEVQTGTGVAKGDKPYSIPTTDENRIQNSPGMLRILEGCPYFITTKMDGTSCTVYNYHADFGCTSRNFNIVEDDESIYWAPNRLYDLRNKLTNLGLNIAIQGEICGPGIQGNKLKLMIYDWFVFDVFNLDNLEYYTYAEMYDFCEKLGLRTVPVEEEGESFNYTLEELLQRARGKYKSGMDKEGIVIRSQDFVPMRVAGKGVITRISFKVLNNDALLKDKD